MSWPAVWFVLCAAVTLALTLLGMWALRRAINKNLDRHDPP